MSHHNPWTPEEFEKLMRPWDATDRLPILERLQHNWAREHIENFSQEEVATLRAALNRLIPEQEGVDLVGFMDRYLHHPLGRGDKQPGMPDEAEVIRIGLRGMDELAGGRFALLDGDRQDELLSKVQKGEAKGGVWDQVPGEYFFERLYGKALHGYFSHPRVWRRIGFMGAAYPEGYRWLGRAQVQARRERHIGWEVM